MFTDIIQKLDIKALPYVIFLVVPVLGRMSDSNDAIRATATNTFASLVKMVPLEVSQRFTTSCVMCLSLSRRLVYQILQSSQQSYLSVGRLSGNSSLNYSMVVKLNNTIYPSLSKPNYASTSKME